MGFLRAFLLSTLALGAACVQFGIPAVESIVANILATNGDYIHFHGNQINSTSVSNYTSHAESTSLFKRQSSYWYENINHQGISAFGPSGYQVFRNVKDFGAQGMSSIYIDNVNCRANTKINKGME